MKNKWVTKVKKMAFPESIEMGKRKPFISIRVASFFEKLAPAFGGEGRYLSDREKILVVVSFKGVNVFLGKRRSSIGI